MNHYSKIKSQQFLGHYRHYVLFSPFQHRSFVITIINPFKFKFYQHFLFISEIQDRKQLLHMGGSPPRKSPGVTIILIILTHLIKYGLQYQFICCMASTLKMREKIEESRRTCLLRKIRFYEYLIGYNTSVDLDKSPSQNKTANSFFPHINYHARVNTPNNSAHRDHPNSSRVNTIQHQNPPAFVTKTVPRSSRQEGLRPSVGKPLTAGISELTAKSMTPSTRINAPQDKQDAGSNIKENLSTIRNRRKMTLTRRSSPRKRTYIGSVHYVKDKSLADPAPAVAPRKLSIAPWDIEMDYV